MKKKLFTTKKGLLVMLTAVMAMSMTACGNEEVVEEVVEEVAVEEEVGTISEVGDMSLHEAQQIGVGNTSFAFTIVYESNVAQDYIINTDQETIGAALLEAELITGEDSAYGLFVTAVGGVELDYEETGLFWSLYEDGVPAEVGVDSIVIDETTVYSFEATEAY